MLAEMQNAMNLANNQLSSLCPLETSPAPHPTSGSVGPSPPPPPAPTPLVGFSQFPQQLTPPRSPSPEPTVEDVISQVARAHREIFTYAHDKLGTSPGNFNANHASGSPSATTPQCWESQGCPSTPNDNNLLAAQRHNEALNGLRQGPSSYPPTWPSGPAHHNCHQPNSNGHRLCPTHVYSAPEGKAPANGLRQGNTKNVLLVRAWSQCGEREGALKTGPRERQPVFLDAEGGDTFCPGKDILPRSLGFAWEPLITSWRLITV